MTQKFALVCCLLISLAPTRAQPPATPASRPAGATAGDFTVEPLAEGVFAVVRRTPPGLMVDANNVLIVNDQDVVVVDSNGAPAVTREVLAALRRITDKPVRWVINTHHHDDHIRGNQVWRAAFPDVEFLGHRFAREYLPVDGARNRKGFLEGAPGMAGELRKRLASNQSLGGWPLGADERQSYENDLRLLDLVLADGARAEAILPTVAIEDRLTLQRGRRIIEIRHLGRGHTAGDLIVHLPAERIVVAGDLVVWPVPLVGDPQSHVGEWAATLEKLRALAPAILVPGHGPVLRDDGYVKRLIELFSSIHTQAQAAVARGETLAQARQSIDLTALRTQFAGDSGARKVAFAMYVAGPAVAVAWREAVEQRAGTPR